MPTTGLINVKDFSIYKDISGTYTQLACVENAEISLNANLIEVLCKSNAGFKQREYGELDANGSVSGLMAMDSPSGTGAFDLLAHMIAREKVDIRFSTGVNGDKAVSFTACIGTTSLGSQGGGGAIATYSSDFASDGAITIETLS